MAPRNALLGTARLNNFRLNYLPAGLRIVRDAKVGIWIGGADARTRTRIGSIQIQDVLNDAPNSAAFTVDTTAPEVGQDVRITINVNSPRVLFHGTMQSVELSYEGRVRSSVWKCTAADDLSRANMKRPFGTWSQISASQVALQLMTNFAPGITTVHVQQGLPLVSITFDGADTMGTCLKRLATLIGGYFYIEDLDLHLFQSEVIDPPDPIMAGYPFAADPPIAQATNLSQIRTRCYGKGHGEKSIADIAVGETIIPVADTAMFNAAGGQAMSATAREGAQHQKLTYTGLRLGGTGSLVGPGLAPSIALNAALATGTGIESGTHQYAYTWVTPSGETTPSPVVSVTHGGTPDPSFIPVWAYDNDNTGEPPYTGVPHVYAFNPGDKVEYSYTWGTAYAPDWTTAGQHTNPSPTLVHYAQAQTMNALWARPITFIAYYSSNPNIKWVYIWRRVNTGTWQGVYLAQNRLPPYDGLPVNNENSKTIYGSGIPTAAPPANRTTLSEIPIGPSGTTSRKVYRTAANLSQLKLQQTISNNTATAGVQDASADAALGANVPTADTSGLSKEQGQVLAGSTSLLTSGTSPFASTGGWVILAGGQVVRYSGITGNTLTGIPSSGAGSITITVLYGSPILDAPSLTGVTGVVTAMEDGSMIHLWIQVDDVPAQDAMKALDLAQGRTSDGIYEYLISDESKSEAALRDLCTADLKLFSRPLVTVRYATRDQKTKAGKMVAVNLTTPPIVANLMIQDVTISDVEIAHGLSPKYTVSASTVRFSLEDLLRQMAAAAGVNG